MPIDKKRSFAAVRSKLQKFRGDKSDRKGKGKGKGKGFRKGKGKGKRKGKGKGKFKRGPAPINSKFWESKKDDENRTELDGTFSGTVAKYIFKQGWGFIKPDDTSGFPEDVIALLEKEKEEANLKAAEKGKEECDDFRIYFRKPDVDEDFLACHVDPDDAVTFEIYTDDKGVGAHQVKAAGATLDKEKKPIRERTEKGKGKGREEKGKGKRREEKGKGRDKGASKGGKGEKTHVIDLEETDPSFPLRQQIVGEGGANVKHIEDSYGARVTVSRQQPLQVKVSCDSEKKLNLAVSMVEDLIGSVWGEYTAQQKQNRRKAKGAGKDRGDRKDTVPWKEPSTRDKGGKGKGKTDANHTKSIKLRKCDPDFRLRSAIVGDKGSYVKHIQEECKVKINVREEDGQMRFEINADTQDGLRKADAMAKDLIDAAYHKYDEWKAATGGKVKPSQGKDAGKGQKRGRDEAGPAQKRQRL